LEFKSFSKNGKGLKRYRTKNIRKVVLSGSDTMLTNKDSTYFEVLGNKKHFAGAVACFIVFVLIKFSSYSKMRDFWF
jgi:hypothetical protein